jgi:ASC-1-like (ASCH) protein
MIHELKIWPKYFNAIKCGDKRFEYRVNDRGFAVGDMLHLREYNIESGEYTGQEMSVMVTYILEVENMVIMSITNPVNMKYKVTMSVGPF